MANKRSLSNKTQFFLKYFHNIFKYFFKNLSVENYEKNGSCFFYFTIFLNCESKNNNTFRKASSFGVKSEV